MKCLELQELFALEALGALDRVGQSQLTALLAANPDAAAEASAWRDTVAVFAAASAPRRRAPGELRARLLTRIGRTPQLREPAVIAQPVKDPSPEGEPSAPPRARSQSLMTFDYGAAAVWTPISGLTGIRIRVLALNEPQGYRVLHAELDPGACFPAHHHGTGPEDLFVLSGDLVTEGRTLRAGDHFHAEPGTDHRELVSPSGCQAILVEPIMGPEFAVAAEV